MNQFICQFSQIKNYVSSFILLTIFPFALSAQVDSSEISSRKQDIHFIDTNISGSYTLFLPVDLDKLIESYKKYNYTSSGIDGFRVQIFSESGNNAKEHAQQALLDFNLLDSGIPSYIIYQQPNFKVRCGDYRTKAEARRLLKQLSGQYPGAYIVKDNIRILNGL